MPQRLFAVALVFLIGRMLAAAAPAAPLGVAMVANSPDSITLSWYRAPSDDVTGYKVYASETKEGTYAVLATVSERTAMHTNLPAGATRFYKVSAINAEGEGAPSAATSGFTIAPWTPAPFPATVAGNMCITLGSTVVSTSKPISGKLANLVDGLDSTSCRLRRSAELKIKINAEASIADASYLLVHFRTDCGPADYSNDRFARTLRHYVIAESKDSTNGEDGTWTELVTGTNDQLDGVILIPNHQPKWIGVRSSYGQNDEVPAATDRRPMPRDLILSRLEVFRAAPAGQRNDYWIFAGDSLIVQDMPANSDPARKALFSDLVREQYPGRYPIVVHAGRGGEMLKDTLPRMKNLMPALSPPNGTDTPTATLVCWETGFNDVGLGGSLWSGGKLIKSYEAVQELCTSNGLIMVPVRIEFVTAYLNPQTLEPTKDSIFHNTLAVNLGGVDVFARTTTPYACDPKTQLPYADYWTYTRENHATALAKDGVHHTAAGCDGINRLWANVAGKMIYGPAAR